MNAIFSLPLVIFCHIYRPHPHGITVVSVPITTVLPSIYPHSRGITATFVPFTAVPIHMQLSS